MLLIINKCYISYFFFYVITKKADLDLYSREKLYNNYILDNPPGPPPKKIFPYCSICIKTKTCFILESFIIFIVF